MSYSHRDRFWGEWLHRALESYRVPKRLIGTEGQHGPIPRRLFPIFRDRDELPTASVLGEVLNRALADSRFLILICSPAAAASRWVNEEVLEFKRLGGERQIFCLIVDGEPNATDTDQPQRECFPPALRFKLGNDGELLDTRAEPLAADIRENGDGRDNARLKIIAGLLGIGFGELRQRDLQARNRRLFFLAAVTTGVAALTVVLAVQAVFARRAAEKNRQQGEELVSFMLGDLRDKLESLGKLDILDAVGDKATAYFDKLDPDNLNEADLIVRAKTLRQISDIRLNQARAADAVDAALAALALNKKLVDRHPDNADFLFELAQSESSVGAAYLSNQTDRAEVHYLARQRVAQRLAALDQNNGKWQFELASASYDLGSLAFSHNQHAISLSYFERMIEIASAIQPQTAKIREGITNAVSMKATALRHLGRIDEAIELLEKQTDLERELSRQQPNDMRQRFNLGDILGFLGIMLSSSGWSTRALNVSAEGLALYDTLIANDVTDQRYTFGALYLGYIRTCALISERRWEEASSSNNKIEKLAQKLRSIDSENINYIRMEVRIRELAFNIALQQGQRKAAQLAAVAALESAPCGNNNKDQIEEARIECAHAQLLALELAIDEPAAEEHQQALKRALDGLVDSGNTTIFGSLRVREQILNGRVSEAMPALLYFLRVRYQPSDYVFFLQRHCSPVIEREIGRGCIILPN